MTEIHDPVPLDAYKPHDVDDLTAADQARSAPRNGTNGTKPSIATGGPAMRVPPHNLAAEQSLLGAMLISREATTAAVDQVTADDFYKPAHGHIFHAITTLAAAGNPVDPVTLAAQLGPLLDSAGGPAALVSLTADTPLTSNAARYATIVAEHATLRRLIRTAGDIISRAYELPDDPGQLIALATVAIETLGAGAAGTLSDHLVTGPAVLDLPPPQPLIADTLNLDSFAVLFGRPGSGKSVLALDLALHIAAGNWWNKREVHTGHVLYVAAEGQTGLGVRAQAWSVLHRTKIPDRITWLTRPANLLDSQSTGQLITIAKRLEPVLVVIDTLNRSMPGGNENGPEDMGTAIAACDRIRHATGACILLVHHSGKDQAQGARGHSSLLGAVDTELELKNGGDGIITLATSKQKEMPDQGLPLRFALVPTADSVAIGPYSSRIEQDSGLTTNGQTCLDALRSIQIPGGIPSGPWQRSCMAAGVSERSFYDQRKRLLDDGHVANVGTQKTPRYLADEAADAEDF